ncbi:MAG: FecR domain-containing protein [Cyclobacteriaceae bacterium]
MKELKKKFFNNQCTREEAEIFLHWYFSDKGEKEIDSQIEEYWEDKGKSNWDSSVLIEKIMQQIDDSDLYVSQNKKSGSRNEQTPDQPKSARKWFTYWKVAAVLCLAVGISYMSFNLLQDDAVKTELASNHLEKSNRCGQKSTIHLKDGSRIVLNSGSKVKYPEIFSEHERVVELEGEAFFEVARDAKRPFRVKTANTITTALGTSFVINAFKNENEVAVSLISGKIEVMKNGAEKAAFILDPGQGVVYSKSSQNMVIRNIDASKVMAWTNKVLMFEDADIDEVIKRLERWYGVEIVKNDNINGNLTASFSNESLKAVLEGVSYSFSFDYDISDKKVILRSKK